MQRRREKRPALGLIGAGAFGAFAVPHLRPFFDVAVHDPRPDIDRLCAGWGVAPASLAEAAARPVVVLAVPLGALRAAARAAAPHLGPGAMVVDVCSVKVKPLAILREELAAGTRLVGTHPLFGPNSGRDGIAGLKTVVCGEGAAAALVRRFCARSLRLDVRRATPEAHDREMAYVQGLSHLVARSLKALDLPDFGLETAAFARLAGLLDLVGDESAALFDTIVGGNPFAPEALGGFIAAASALAARAGADVRLSRAEGPTCGAGG